MEKDRSGKIIAIVALLVGVVGLTVGFAAFSNTLTISSEAEYNPDENVFNVDFSSSSSSVVDGNLTPTLSPSTGTTPTGATASISNATDPTITGIKATFTAPGQSVTYTFHTKNAGQLKAFLRSITFANAKNGQTEYDSFKKCVPLSKTGDNVTPNPASEDTMNAACAKIGLTLKLANADAAYTASKARTNFNAIHDLEIDGSEEVVLTISYEENAPQADGDFTVYFGDITFVYASTAADA